MRITCEQAALSTALAVAGRVVTPRASLPITGHVLLEAQPDGRLQVTGTNLDESIVARLAAEVAEPGKAAVPARLLTDVVRALPAGPLALTLTDGRSLAVRTPQATANLVCSNPAKFPLVDVVDGAPFLTLPARDLAVAIGDVLFAAAKDDARPALNGVFLRAEGDTLTLVGCDGFRMSLRTLPLPAALPEGVEAIVPARALGDVARLLGDGDGVVEVARSANGGRLGFHTADVDLVTRVVDGQYVDYGRLLKQTERHDVQVTVETAALQRAVRFTSFVARDASDALRLTVEAAALRLAATAAQVGDNTTAIDALVVGKTAAISLSNRYLAEAVAAVRAGQVVCSATAGQTVPVQVRPVGDDTVRHLIMPMAGR